LAIFGSLNHMSLDDLLPFVSSRDGALEIFNLKRLPRVTLYFHSGKLQCVYLGNKPLDSLQARSVISELVAASNGSFEFIPEIRPPTCDQPLGWSIDRMLISVAATLDEYAQVVDRLPHPETVFSLTHITVPDDTRISDFWKRAYIYLQEGISAQELSEKLGMPLDHCRFYLHKLRQLGAVAPVRFEARREKPQHAGVAARLLTSLKKRFFGEDNAWSR